MILLTMTTRSNRPTRVTNPYLVPPASTAATTNGTRRAGIYCRISKDHAKEGLGVARQEKDCRELAARKGWEVVDVYIDNDVSATRSRRRPRFEDMISDAATRKINAIIFYNHTRLTRQLGELEKLVNMAGALDIQLANVTGEFDISTAAGQQTAYILGAIAKGETAQQGERIQRKMKELREKGRSTGGARPYGWTGTPCDVRSCAAQHSPFHIVPEEAAIIVECSNRVLAGESLRSILADLVEREIPTARGGYWGRTALRQVLCRARNAGLVETRGTVVATATEWDPIVDIETWRSVRALLLDPARRRTGSGNGRKYLLSGVAKCGVCGEPMVAGFATWTNKSGTRQERRTYRCSTLRSDHVSRHQGAINELVTEAVIARLAAASPEDLLRPHLDDAAVDLEAEAERIRTKLNIYAEDYSADRIDHDTMVAGVKALRAQLEEVNRLREPVRAEQVLRDFVGADEVRDTWEALPMDRKRAVVDTICTVTIKRTGRSGRGFDPTSVDIAWK